jgi:hypothetical protein
MEAFKIEDKHGIILYDSTLAGVGLDVQDEEEDPQKKKSRRMKKMKQKSKQKMQQLKKKKPPKRQKTKKRNLAKNGSKYRSSQRSGV